MYINKSDTLFTPLLHFWWIKVLEEKIMCQSNDVIALPQDKFYPKYPSDDNLSPTFSTILELEKYHEKNAYIVSHLSDSPKCQG